MIHYRVVGWRRKRLHVGRRWRWGVCLQRLFDRRSHPRRRRTINGRRLLNSPVLLVTTNGLLVRVGPTSRFLVRVIASHGRLARRIAFDRRLIDAIANRRRSCAQGFAPGRRLLARWSLAQRAGLRRELRGDIRLRIVVVGTVITGSRVLRPQRRRAGQPGRAE